MSQCYVCSCINGFRYNSSKLSWTFFNEKKNDCTAVEVPLRSILCRLIKVDGKLFVTEVGCGERSGLSRRKLIFEGVWAAITLVLLELCLISWVFSKGFLSFPHFRPSLESESGFCKYVSALESFFVHSWSLFQYLSTLWSFSERYSTFSPRHSPSLSN